MVVRDPLCESPPIHLTAGNGQHGCLGGVDAGGQLHAIQHQGDLQRGMTDALVLVHKGVVLDKREGECGSFGDQPAAASASGQATVELCVLVEHPLGSGVEVISGLGDQIPHRCSGQLRI